MCVCVFLRLYPKILAEEVLFNHIVSGGVRIMYDLYIFHEVRGEFFEFLKNAKKKLPKKITKTRFLRNSS